MKDDLAIFAENLRRISMNQGVKPTPLSMRAGLSSGSVSDYLNRRRVPKLHALLALADALNVAPADLIRGCGADGDF